MKTHIISLLAIVLGATATQAVFAVSIAHNIVLTENSSTSLTATYDGSTTGVTVILNSPDNWVVNVPATVSFNGMGIADSWIEPENASLSNFVSGSTNAPQLAVVSEFNLLGDVANGSQSPFIFGTDSSNSGFVFVTFNDNGDTAASTTVPDTGSALGLLFVSVIALLGVGSFGQARLA
jgi:hypothetical protein